MISPRYRQEKHQMMSGYGYHDMDNWGWFGMFLMLIVAIAVIALVVNLLLRASSLATDRSAVGAGGEDRSLTILRERLARGEVTSEEYERIRTTLTNKPS